MISRIARRGRGANTVSTGRRPSTPSDRSGGDWQVGGAKVMLDYCSFKENVSRSADEHTEKEEATVSLTALVMKEMMCDSVWAYALKSKNVAEDPWIADQIVDDLNTIGMGRNRIIVKTGQEASIVEL